MRLLSAQDFSDLCAAFDAAAGKYGRLQGLMVVTSAFPGWQHFDGLGAPPGSIGAHRGRIVRVAVIGDNPTVRLGPPVVGTLLRPAVRRFTLEDRPAGLVWPCKGRIPPQRG